MDDIANAIAVIGIYFALMAVLAVTVEAVIGWFKVPVPWLQGTPSTDDVLNEVKGWLPAEEEGEDDEKARTAARIVALNKALDAIKMEKIPLTQELTLAEIAEKVGEATTERIKQDRVRRAVIRLMAVVMGIVFAVLFQIDTLRLVGPLSQPAQDLWLNSLGESGAHVVGLVLSGMAASAGSSFWHDQSARLRQLKDAVG